MSANHLDANDSYSAGSPFLFFVLSTDTPFNAINKKVVY